MRTNFQQRSSLLGRVRTRIFFIALAFIVILLAAPGPLSTMASVILSPLHGASIMWQESTHPIPAYFRDRSALVSRIDMLESENASLRESEAARTILEEELSHLGRILDSDSRIIADILRTPGETPYDTLVVAAGSDDGVVAGALAYAGSSAIGQVARTMPKTSVVVLFSTSGVRIPVYLWGARVFAHAEGMGGGVVRIGVPQGLKVEVGDPVSIPVRGTAIFGVVSHVESDATNPEQYAYVVGDESLRSMRFIAIDRDPMIEISRSEAEAAIDDIRTGVVPSPLAPLLTALPLATTTASATPAVIGTASTSVTMTP